MAENTNSVSGIFSPTFNVHQKRELNPEAPAYIPLLPHHHHASTTTNTTSSYLYCHNHHCPPLPLPYTLIPSHPPPPPMQTAFYYFQPLILQPPQVGRFTQLIPQAPTQNQLTWSQPNVDRLHVLEPESGRTRSTVSSRRCGGSWGRRRVGGIWRVKSGPESSADQLNRRPAIERCENKANRVTLTSAVNESQEHRQYEDSSEYRIVKYMACKKIGKKFEIQPVDKSARKTTVMIRNIPNRYTRELMLTFLDRHCMEVNQKMKLSFSTDDDGCCLSAYDFFYMPMDFKTGLNKSYAFVNFTTPEAVWRFHAMCDSQKWELFESIKIRQIAVAKFQGTGELIEHFGRTAFACDCDEFLPVYFKPPRDGHVDVHRVISIIGKRVG